MYFILARAAGKVVVKMYQPRQKMAGLSFPSNHDTVLTKAGIGNRRLAFSIAIATFVQYTL